MTTAKNRNFRDGDGGTRSDLRELLERVGLSIASRAGISPEDWRALSESEQIAITELVDDTRLAEGMPLEQYRAMRRRWIEQQERAGEQCRIPQWLRDVRAMEQPERQVVYFLRLVAEAITATPERLKEISGIVDCNRKHGFIGSPATVNELRERVREEIERAGLGDVYREAERQQAERADQ